jgi:hypothetical protein
LREKVKSEHLKEFASAVEIAKVFENENPSGDYHFQIVFSLPPDFVSDYEAALRRATASWMIVAKRCAGYQSAGCRDL